MVLHLPFRIGAELFVQNCTFSQSGSHIKLLVYLNDCGSKNLNHQNIFNPQRACTARVTVVVCVCVCVCVNSPMEHGFILKALSCTQQATKVKFA